MDILGPRLQFYKCLTMASSKPTTTQHRLDPHQQQQVYLTNSKKKKAHM